MAVIDRSAENIKRFHEKQKRSGYEYNDGERVLGQRLLPIKRVGLYVPGGSAAYPSSVLMNAIPAKIAGVSEIIMVTPPKLDGINPAVIYAANAVGIDKIYLVGGAQAVAALAYGTESIPKADLICGPGNLYVATAKKLLFGVVGIDMAAGPSEVVIIADETADPDYVIADLLAQAEHDVLASSVLITDSELLANSVTEKITEVIENSERKDIIKKSICEYGAVLITESLKHSFELANRIAPEHLEIMTEKPEEKLSLVENAGAVFLGAYAPEVLGDYMAGPNHVLPTNSTARFFSGLGVDTFMRRQNYIIGSKKSFEKDLADIEKFASSEGLCSHAASATVRRKKM